MTREPRTQGEPVTQLLRPRLLGKKIAPPAPGPFFSR